MRLRSEVRVAPVKRSEWVKTSPHRHVGPKRMDPLRLYVMSSALSFLSSAFNWVFGDVLIVLRFIRFVCYCFLWRGHSYGYSYQCS